jgi:carbamoyl-phosphate synthase large subunit
VRREDDDAVLQVVADAVHKNTWEPADNPAVIDLRLWADARTPAAAERPVASPCRTKRIIVTGAGGPAGVAVIRALGAQGYDVVAVDADPLAAGSRIADASDVVPHADDARYVDTLVDIASRHDARAIIATITEEMIALSRREREVQRVASVWLPSTAALEACRDKWRFAEVAHAAGIPVPATALHPDEQVPGPWVVKPRFARGSRGVRYIESFDELQDAMDATDHPIVQTRLRGAEFTVDALVSREGEVVGAVPRWRLETKAGISTKGRTFANERVLRVVVEALAAFELTGAANVQGFVEPDGDVRIVEINPRFSGGLPLSLHAGADLVGEYVRGLEGRAIRSEALTFEAGRTMVRHFEEIYV